MAAAADLVEHLHRQAAGIGRRLQHQRRDGGDQRGLGHPLRAVAADVAGHFAAARGEADQDGALQVERLDELREVVGIGVHVVAVPGLARPAMSAPVMGDAAIAVGGQEHHLGFPAIRAERPAVAEHHRLSCAPVLVVDLRSVFRRDRAHGLPPLVKEQTGLKQRKRTRFYYPSSLCLKPFCFEFVNVTVMPSRGREYYNVPLQ